MKTILIKRLHLLNFKGVADLTIEFDAHTTDIAGRNGSGKTSVFDAFTWLMFGKDSQNRTDFDIKTLDTDGKIIYQLPHEVSATITVDGTEMVLCRRLTEKWVKRNGEQTFTGNIVERFIDDVPCKEKDFNAKIAEICDEDTFRKITSPTFFVSQSADKQKSDLMRMSGEIADADIAAGNPEFEMLLRRMGNKTFDEFGREIGAKKKRIKNELADIPGRMDERKRDIAELDDDWRLIEVELAAVTDKYNVAFVKLTDINLAAKAAADERHRVSSEIADKRDALRRRRTKLTDNAMYEYNQRRRDAQNLAADIETMRNNIARMKRMIMDENNNIVTFTNRRQRMLDEYRALTARRNAIAAETLTFDDDDFKCPTCHRAFDVADIAAKQTEMSERFERDRAKRLERIAADIAANMDAGKRNNADMTEAKQRGEKLESDIAAATERMNAKQSELDAMNEIAMPDVEPIIAADERVIALNDEIAALEAHVYTEAPDNAELRRQCDVLNAQITELRTRLSRRDRIADNERRVEELEKQYRKLNDELTEYEHLEYIIDEFNKAKNEAIDQRINGMFNIVKFRWVKYRINGTENETCEATINGVPYSALNTAGRITAGIDIINAICRFEDVTAPIIIDNAESLNVIPETASQQIRLIVSNDERITVKQNSETNK